MFYVQFTKRERSIFIAKYLLKQAGSFPFEFSTKFLPSLEWRLP